MKSEWHQVKLEEIVKIKRGSSPRPIQQFLSSTGMPWVKISDATNSRNRYIESTKQFIIKEGIKNSVTVEPGTLIVSNSATPGIPKIMGIQACCHDGWLIFSNYKMILKDFLYYSLIFHRNDICVNANGSVFQNLKIDILKNFKIDLPPLEIQKKIVSFLLSIDNKIEINNKINDNLEQQAKIIYNTFFPYSINDNLPEDWHLGTIDEIIELHDSKRIPLSGAQRAQMKKRIYPYYGASSLMDYVDDYIFDGKYLLLGEDGTVVDDAGYPILQYVWGKFWVNNHAHVLTGKNGFNIDALFLLFKRINVQSIITGAVQPKINQANLCSLNVVVPPLNILQKFTKQIQPLFEIIRLNYEQNKFLKNLRDTLLPRLMSGTIEVS